jgi:tRNA 2-thiouridine synthesizing protein A
MVTGEDFERLRDTLQTLNLVDELRAIRGSACFGCGTPVCSHEAHMSLAMGFKDRPHCSKCLGKRMGVEAGEMRTRLLNYFSVRPCHRVAWMWANRDEGFDLGEANPPCLAKDRPKPSPGSSPKAPRPSGSRNGGPKAEIEWDAGEMGCGDLVLELRRRLRGMSPGQILKLRATDRGAREDLPAWSRLTGNTLIASDPPLYWIQRKES